MLVVSAVPATLLARDIRSTAAMNSAPTCSTPDTVRQGCRALIAVHITGITHARSAASVHIDGPASVAGTYAFDGDSDLLDLAEVGDRAAAQVWDGRVVAFSDRGHRSLTSKAPQVDENRMLALALLAFSAGLALVVRYALGAQPPDGRFRSWIRSPRWPSIVYRATLLLVAASLVDVRLVLESGGRGPLAHPLVNVPAAFVLVAAVLGLNEIYLARRLGRPAAVGRRTAARLGVRAFLAYASIVLGLIAAVVSAATAFASATQGARDRAAVDATPCPAGASGNCLSTQWATVWGADPSGDEPAIFVQWSLAPARWVYFTARERSFVRTLTTGQLVGVEVWHDDVVSVSPLGASRSTPADLSYDDVPAGTALLFGVAALAALALGIRVRRPRSPRRPTRRLRAEVPAAALLLAGAAASRAGTWWPYLLVAAFVVVCLPTRRVRPAAAGPGVESSGTPGTAVRA
jgi:hypothetical protein